MSKKLNIHLEIYDNEDIEENNYLSIILPIIKKDKTTEDDEFNDDDIDEMIENNNALMEEKLKRKLPNNQLMGERRNSLVSSINFVDDINSRNYEDKKETSESFISLPKMNFKNENNANSILNSNYIAHSSNNLNNNDIPKGTISINSFPSNDSLFSKCIKDYSEKKFEKEKSKFQKESHTNIKLIKNEINNHSSNKNI